MHNRVFRDPWVFLVASQLKPVKSQGMENQQILYPVCGLILLTMIMQFSLMRARITAIKKARVRAQAIAESAKFDEIMRGTENISDHFENLFEIPVLFYVAALTIFILQITDPIYLVAAWAFVGLRYAHSYIHCTYNNIMHRFFAYFLSSMIVWAIWARIAFQLFTR